MANRPFADATDVERFKADFHRVHREIFAVDDPGSPVEIIGWRARVRCQIHDRDLIPDGSRDADRPRGARTVFMRSTGEVEVPIVPLGGLPDNESTSGPLIIESPVTTIVVDPDATAIRTATGSVLITLNGVTRINESEVQAR